MNITLRQINIFVEVARQLSITKAANRLYLTQPAVSMQIKQLESMVDVPLVNLVGKKLELTQRRFSPRRTTSETLGFNQVSLLTRSNLSRFRRWGDA